MTDDPNKNKEFSKVLNEKRETGQDWFSYQKENFGNVIAGTEGGDEQAGGNVFSETQKKDNDAGGEEKAGAPEIKRKYGQEAEGTEREPEQGKEKSGAKEEEEKKEQEGEEGKEKQGGENENKEDSPAGGLEMQAQEEAADKEKEKKEEGAEKQKKEGGESDDEKKSNLDQNRAEDGGKEQESGEGKKEGEDGQDKNKDGDKKGEDKKEKKSAWQLIIEHQNILQIALIFDILAIIPFLSILFNLAFRWILYLYFLSKPKIEEKGDITGDVKAMANIKLFGVSPKELLLYFIDSLIGIIPMNLWAASSRIFELKEQEA